MKRLLILSLALWSVTALAGSGKWTVMDLHELAGKGTPEVTDQYTNRVPADTPLIRYTTRFSEDTILEGIVTASPVAPDHANLEMPFQSSFYDVNIKLAQKCAYMEDPDGRAGVELMFLSDAAARKLNSASHAKLNLKGCVLIKEGNRCIIDGLKTSSIVFSGEAGSAEIPRKERYISELTPEDIFTFVTLKDCEFVFKNGCLGNMDEVYISKNPEGRNLGTNRADGWEKLITDSRGDRIYMHVNANMTGRRAMGGVPQGTGTISGIIVDTYNPRYGNTHSFGIRPPSAKDIHFERSGNEPGYFTLAAWDWNVPTTGFIPAEYGRGYMTCDVPGSTVGRIHDWDNPRIDLPKDNFPDSRGLRGRVDDGALQITAPACSWWNWEEDAPRALVLAIPTGGVKARQLFVAFTMSAGCQKAKTAQNYPSYWTVSYSADGKEFTKTDASDATMRSLPVHWVSRGEDTVDGHKYEMSAEAGLGYTEHVFQLPAQLLEAKMLYIKITPAKKIVATLSYLNRDCRALTPEFDAPCYVNFGEVIVGYR